VSIYLLVFFSRVALLLLGFVYMFSGVIARLAYSWRRHHPPSRNPLPSSQGPVG
jgi:CDP-diacylglycerol--serine O-phosphatidyltransferase